MVMRPFLPVNHRMLVRRQASFYFWGMAPYEIELVGGHPALDFLNTVHDWTEQPRRDRLVTFGDAVRFGEAAGVLERVEVRALEGRDGGGELTRLVALRDVLQRVTDALIGGRASSEADLEALATTAVEVASRTHLERVDGRLRRVIDVADAGSALLRLRIADAALALLASDDTERQKSCPACGWFFVDTSRNRSRRWCSMSTCGASAKSRRYYRRAKAARAGDG